MQALITCPHCHQSFEPSQAFQHELDEKLTKLKSDLEAEKTQELAKLKSQVADEALTQAKKQLALEIKDKEEQINSLTKQAKQAQELELQIRREKRVLEDEKRNFELEKQRQLDAEREKIRQETLKQATETHELKDKEKEMVIENLRKALSDAQRKAQQGSQQTQGEVMEIELENLLRQQFPNDQISEVKKGARGADVVHQVIDKFGRPCGTILWESKNAKWQPAWIGTLKENQRNAKAQIAVLLASEPPADIDTFTYRDGIWIVRRPLALALANALRYNLIAVNSEKLSQVNKSDKAHVLFEYVTSTEFKLRIEAIVGSFADMQADIEKEKRWFTAKWAKQEKSLRRVIDHTIGMRSDMEGVIGVSLPPVSVLELTDGNEQDSEA